MMTAKELKRVQRLEIENRELRKQLEHYQDVSRQMIGSAKVQVEYYALRKESPRIEWLESPNAKVSGVPPQD